MNLILAQIISFAVWAFQLLILIEVIGSWILAAGARLPNWAYNILQAVHSMTAPVLAPIRRLLPNFGGFDLSPIIALLLINWLGGLIVNALYGRI